MTWQQVVLVAINAAQVIALAIIARDSRGARAAAEELNGNVIDAIEENTRSARR